jgi:Brp/Blh family beta-carotene 15,15'-monooxygenase
MRALAQPVAVTGRRALSGRGDIVYPAYWIAAVALLMARVLGLPLAGPFAVTAATLLFIAGGLPHGAYDIALLRRAVVLDRYGLVLAVGAYIAIAASMAMLWLSAPLIALIVFLVVAAVHFGEDWPMLDEPLLRFAAGAAVIAAPTIWHRIDVSAMFVEMSNERATLIAQIITAAAPVTLLVTAVGVGAAWREGSRKWAGAMTLCLLLLVLLPPVAGFALFFVFLHSPRHLAQTRVLLCEMSLARWLTTGALLSCAAVLGWCALQRLAHTPIEATMAAKAFQLLASVAVPHLLLSRWLENRLARQDLSQRHPKAARGCRR